MEVETPSPPLPRQPTATPTRRRSLPDEFPPLRRSEIDIGDEPCAFTLQVADAD